MIFYNNLVKFSFNLNSYIYIGDDTTEKQQEAAGDDDEDDLLALMDAME